MAEFAPSYDKNRVDLRSAIPLRAPLSMYIEPTRMCNLKCFYCMHATRGNPCGVLAQTGFELKHMDMGLYDKITDEIMRFPVPPKRAAFSGLGEPLMNPNLCKMAKILRGKGFTGRNDILTNAVLLTPALADELVDSGIDRIQISIQSLSSGGYKHIAGVSVNFNQLVENITYLYKHKKQTQVFIKIIDANLKNEAEKKAFFEIFSPICDTIYVEHLVVLEQQMGDHGGITNRNLNLNGEPFTPRDVCGIMFYFVQVNVDGDTYPCSTPGLPSSFSMGNAHAQTLLEIWNGGRRNAMLKENLAGGYRAFAPCRECSSVICITDPAEYLDDYRAELLARLQK